MLNILFGDSNVFLVFFKLDNVIISAYSLIVCIYLYIYIYLFVKFFSKFLNQYFNVFKVSLGLFLLIAHTQLYNNSMFYQITIQDLLFISVLEAWFINSINLHVYSKDNLNFSFVVFIKTFIRNLINVYTNLLPTNNKQICWAPIFKKTSYFGLYKSFRNKWPF